MEKFNSNNYKKQTVVQDFRHSCLGKLIILLVIIGVFAIIAMFTRPSDSMMRWQTEDNIKECLIASDSIQSDAIDDYVENLGRIFTHADSTEVDPETWKIFIDHNQVAIYPHALFKTAYIHNNVKPEGVRVAFGIFGVVIPTIKYSDMLLNLGNIRGEYGEQLIRRGNIPDNSLGENPNVQPYHYKGDADN